MPIKSIWGETEDEVLDALERIDQETNISRRDLKSRWEKALKFFRQGQIGSQSDIFRVNLVNMNIRRGAAMLTEMKPEILVTARKEGLGKTADILTKVIHAIWEECQLQMVFEDLVTIAKIMQSSFCQIAWNPQEHYGLGNIEIRALDPRVVGVDPHIKHARDLKYAQYIWVDTVVPLYVAKTNFPKRASEIEPSTFSRDDIETEALKGQGLKRVLSRLTYGDKGGQGTQAVPRVVLRTYWLKDPATDENGSPLYPNGRVIVKARDQDLILNYDKDGVPGQPSPYYDGEPPIEWLDLSPDIDSPWGLEEISAVKHLQSAYNRIGDALVTKSLQDAINTWVTDTNALGPEAIDFLRNAGFYVLERAVGRTVDKRPGELQVPFGINLLTFLHSLMDQLSGVADSAQVTGSRGRAEIRSAPMLEGLQHATQVLIRAQARRLESFIERLGHKLISRIFQFYTDDRIMTYTTSSGNIKKFRFQRQELIAELVELATDELRRRLSSKPEGYASPIELTQAALGGAQTQVVAKPEEETKITADEILKIIKGAWRDFRFHVKPLSSVSLVRMQRAQLAIQLSQANLIPTRVALSELGYENPNELLQEVREELEIKNALGLQPQAVKPSRSKRS